MADNRYEQQKEFWEYAGSVSYDTACFSSVELAAHIMGRHWRFALETAERLGISAGAKVADIGCGDGKFANTVLANFYARVDAFDVSAAAVERGRHGVADKNKVNFHHADMASYDFAVSDYWDCVFLMGFLHHVKPFSAAIIKRLAKISNSIVVVEPNGNNLIRKGLELSPSYRQAGEDSYQRDELVTLFAAHGYELKTAMVKTLVPSFLPSYMLPVMKGIEAVVERFSLFSPLCSTYILGFQKPDSQMRKE